VTPEFCRDTKSRKVQKYANARIINFVCRASKVRGTARNCSSSGTTIFSSNLETKWRVTSKPRRVWSPCGISPGPKWWRLLEKDAKAMMPQAGSAIALPRPAASPVSSGAGHGARIEARAGKARVHLPRTAPADAAPREIPPAAAAKAPLFCGNPTSIGKPSCQSFVMARRWIWFARVCDSADDRCGGDSRPAITNAWRGALRRYALMRLFSLHSVGERTEEGVNGGSVVSRRCCLRGWRVMRLGYRAGRGLANSTKVAKTQLRTVLVTLCGPLFGKAEGLTKPYSRSAFGSPLHDTDARVRRVTDDWWKHRAECIRFAEIFIIQPGRDTRGALMRMVVSPLDLQKSRLPIQSGFGAMTIICAASMRTSPLTRMPFCELIVSWSPAKPFVDFTPTASTTATRLWTHSNAR